MILNSYEVNLSVFFFTISIMYCFKRSIPSIFAFKSYISLGYFSLTLYLCLFHGKNKNLKKIVYLVISNIFSNKPSLYTNLFLFPVFKTEHFYTCFHFIMWDYMKYSLVTQVGLDFHS